MNKLKTISSEWDYILDRADTPDRVLAAEPAAQQHFTNLRNGMVKKGIIALVAGTFAMIGVSSAEAQINPFQMQQVYNTLSNPYSSPVNKGIFVGGQLWSQLQQVQQQERIAAYRSNQDPTDIALAQKDHQLRQLEKAIELQEREQRDIARLQALRNGTAVPAVQHTYQTPQYQAPRYNDQHLTGPQMNERIVQILGNDSRFAFNKQQLNDAIPFQQGIVLCSTSQGKPAFFTLDERGGVLKVPYDPRVSVPDQIKDIVAMRDLPSQERTNYENSMYEQRAQAYLAQRNNLNAPQQNISQQNVTQQNIPQQNAPQVVIPQIPTPDVTPVITPSVTPNVIPPVPAQNVIPDQLEDPMHLN